MNYGDIYRHYKAVPGSYKGYYAIIGIARENRSNQVFVLYRNPASGNWLRPIDMFNETVTVEEETVDRFLLIKEAKVSCFHQLDNLLATHSENGQKYLCTSNGEKEIIAYPLAFLNCNLERVLDRLIDETARCEARND
jgi:hypothetical protein